MRLLVFEFITGGGFIKQALPQSLLQEGYLMRNALLDDLGIIADLELLVLQDERLALNDAALGIGMQYVQITQTVDLQTFLSARQSDYDAVWLIAPETDGILAQWCQFFSEQSKYLFTSAQQAVAICQDKLGTSKLLQQAGIASVPSRLYDFTAMDEFAGWVIKVNDSVGCDQVFLIARGQDGARLLAQLAVAKTYIIQPFIKGRSLSLSCLFYQGNAYYICCNQQHTEIEQQQFVLTACKVNIQNNHAEKYQALCQAVAEAIPQLFGYVGIDFIETETGENLILEINPRLTTSYAGIKAALGVNIAELVLKLPEQVPLINKTRDQQVTVDIRQGLTNAS